MRPAGESSVRSGWAMPWRAGPDKPRSPARPAEEKTGTQQITRLRRLRRLARFADTAVRVPGTRIRFGADSLVGLLPGVGDGLMAFLSIYIIYEASRLGVSKRTLVRMVLNVAVDLGIGSVPLAGDAFDLFFKANKRNVELLEAELGMASVP